VDSQRARSVVQAVVEEHSAEIRRVEVSVQNLREELAASSHENVLADTSVKGRRRLVRTLEDTMKELKRQVPYLKGSLVDLDTGLTNLLGDSVLAAALIVYAGALSWEEKCRALEEWKGVLGKEGLQHSRGFTMSGFMEVTERHLKVLPRGVILDESMQTMLYSLAFVRCSHVPRLLCVSCMCPQQPVPGHTMTRVFDGSNVCVMVRL
jgi:hypothetical protein